jgi:NDP-sugar pyrophosphorylase family protein
MSPTLLVLAAGMGSRYGGLKQLDSVGPHGETILDYSVFDAMRAGFGKVVFVIREDFAELFREKIGAKYAGKIEVDYVFQKLDKLPVGFAPQAGREKPWGTGHAIWSGAEKIAEPFAAINADDFYGLDAYRQLVDFLQGASIDAQPATYSMVGYRLGNTLSEHGSVARGVCTVSQNGLLEKVEEIVGIENHADGPRLVREGIVVKFTGDEIVSLNCWGFTPSIFSALEKQFADFLRKKSGDMKAEFYIPSVVAKMIAQGEATVSVLPTTASWFGVTYREDKPRVTAALAQLVASGEYPERLWSE